MSSVDSIPSTAMAPVRACPHCGAALDPADRTCWLCLTPVGEPVADTLAPKPLMTPLLSSNYSLASLMLFITLVAVVLGVATQWPGLGIPLGIVAFIIWTRTVNVVRERNAAGIVVTPLEKVQIFSSSFVVTIVILILIAVAGGAALGTACAAMFAAAEPDAVPWFFGLAIVTLLAIAALIWIFRAINRRGARPQR